MCSSDLAVLDVRAADAWPLPALHVDVDVVAFAATTASAALSLRGGVEAPQQTDLQLAPGVVTTRGFDLVRTADGGELVVAIEMADDLLATDDRLVVRLPPLPAPRIAVLQEGETSPFARVAASALAAEVGGAVVAVQAKEPIGFLKIGRAHV